jgi:LCP family protein required for cell wall assembly
MTRAPAKVVGTLLLRMAPDEKPYRVYRGGRVKGKVPVNAPVKGAAPTKQRRARAATAKPARGAGAAATTNGGGPGWRRRLRLPPLRRPRWRRLILLGILVLIALFVVWAVTGYLAVRSGVKDANKRVEPGTRAALAKQNGLLLSHPTTILLLGTDSAPVKGRAGLRHSDSIMLVRTDPSHHRISYLSIPRDLYVPVHGLGQAKINAAYQAGGAPLAIRTIREYTGLKINHVVIVDFSKFEDLIDAEGGIDVNVPAPILSNRFDCPYDAAGCAKWDGWRFSKGRQHMDGHRALIYSRIRENQLNPRESDFTRAARQQAVMQAATAKLTSPGLLLKLPFKGKSLTAPLTTDLTPAQFLELGWVKKRASNGNTLYCRLGGDPSFAGSQSVIVPSEDNRNALAMWQGDSAPQRPTTTYGPGCAKGHPLS